MTTTVDDELQALWANRVRWSRGADAMKRRLDRARVAALALSSAGAVIATASATGLAGTPGAWMVSLVGAGVLAGATFLSAQVLTSESTRRWTRARATSEEIKQQFFRFRAHAAPYTGAGALVQLQMNIADIENASVDLEPYLPDRASVAAKPVPPDLTPDSYVRQRVEDQIAYYRDSSSRYARRSRRIRMLVTGLGFLAFVAAAIGAVPMSNGVTGMVTAWVAVLTTLGGAVAVYLSARRYEFMIVNFTASANRLQNRLNGWRHGGAPADDAAWSAFVNDCETIIAAENESWVAKWSDPHTSS